MSSESQTDLQSFQDLALKFARRELEPKAIDLDDYPFVEFNRAAIDSAREVGLFQVLVPEEQGGIGQGMPALCEIIQNVAQADGGFATIVFVNSLAQSALLKWGSAGLTEKHLSGGLIAFPVYDLPTDLPVELKAGKTDDGYTLNGRVEFLPLAPVAEAMVVPAQLEGSEQVAFFVVETRAAGVTVGEPLMSLGLRTCPVADVEFKEVKVPAGNLLWAEANVDYASLAASFRPAAAALAVGVCAGSYEAAKSYAKERYQGGRMIVDYDQVRLMLANLAVVAESGKSLVRAMARAVEEGKPWPVSDAGLILISEQASRATTDGVQCLGGYGYMKDYGQEKRMRDAKQIESIFGAAPAKRLDLMEEILRQEE